MFKVILCYSHSAEFDFAQWVSAQRLVMGNGPVRRIWLLLWPTCAVGQCTDLVMGYVQVCNAEFGIAMGQCAESWTAG